MRRRREIGQNERPRRRRFDWWQPLAVVGFLAALAVGGLALLNFAVDGAYREAVVLDTWTEETCGWSGPSEHRTYSCTTSRLASVSYRADGREHIAEVQGSYEVGERTEVYVGRVGVFSSKTTAVLACLFAAGFIGAILWGALFD
jgi:hypothetical protein